MKSGAKYQILFETLKEGIQQGKYGGGEKLPGETELAQTYGFSRQTVRQALSLLEQEGLIQRRQGSGTYVKELAVRKKRSWNVGVMATYISEYIFPPVLRGIEEELSANGFFPMISATKNRVDNERQILEGYLDKQIDGLIVEGTKSALPNPNLALYEKLRERGIPVVFFNGYYPALENTVSVTMNDKRGGQEAVNYLASRGHKKIGAIFKGDDMQGTQRYAGYLAGMLENNLLLRDEWVLWYNSESKDQIFATEEGKELVLKALADCTAVICYNDEIAAKLVHALLEKGISIPGQKAVLSFDNSLISEISPVRITSLDHPKEQLGACAARKLVTLMNGGEAKSVQLDWGFSEKDSV